MRPFERVLTRTWVMSMLMNVLTKMEVQGCVCARPPGEFCLNKSCLRLVLSTVAKAGDEAFGRSAAK